MLFFSCALLAATAFFGRTAAEISDLSPKLLQRDESQNRVLTAITLRSELERREVDFTLKHTCEHHYADHVPMLRGESARFATTSMSFKLPTLALEDIENQLDSIECLDSIIALEFVDGQVLKQARKAWDDLTEFIVISSHPGCNRDGERAPYVVSHVTYNTDEATAVFTAHQIEWNEAYAATKVDFGMTGMSPSRQYSISGLRFHDNLRRRLGRRQAAASSTFTYPSAPTSTPSSESSVQNINYSKTNTSIISTDEFIVGCTNCTLAGVLDITHGTFTVNGSATNEIERVTQFIKDGFFSAVANDVSARIELDTTILLMASKSFSQNIFTIALPGFQIPGIATVGPQFSGALVGSIDISNPINFTYGFDLTIPDGSSINLDVGNLTNSSSHGFSSSTITALPFGASSDGVTVTLSIGLQTEVLLGVSLLSGSGDIQAGIFLDLPTLSVSISSLSGVNADCEPITSSNTVNGLLSHIFPNLTHIVPSAVVDIGLTAGATLIIPDVTTIQTDAATTLAGTEYTLETVCLSWDSKATAFVEPTFSTTTAATTVAATGIGPGSGSGNGNGGEKESSGIQLQDDNPFARASGLAWATGMVLGFTMLVFAAL